MTHRLTEVDLDRPLQPVRLPENACAAGIILYRSGWPVEFLLRWAPPGQEISPDQLQEWLDVENIPAERPIPQDVCNRPGVSLTVAVCTKDRPELLARCLDSILTVCAPAPEVEILVIDNAPSDSGTREVVAARPRVRYVCEMVPGLNFARNRAVHEAQGELLAYVDDDATLAASWLAGVRLAWHEHPDAGGAVGPVLPYELETVSQYRFERFGGFGRRFLPLRQVHPDAGRPLAPGQIFGAGCNMIFRRRIIQELGGFDEALDTGAPLPGGGDLDMLFRVQQAGYPFLNEPLCVIYHQHRRTHKALRRQMWTWGLTMTAYLSKIYQQDPLSRPILRRYFGRWLWQQCRSAACRILKPAEYPPDLVFAQLLGGLVALTGTYRRSVARSRRLRSLAAAP